MSVLLNCEICGREFSVKPYRANKARFCSFKCGGSWHMEERLNSPEQLAKRTASMRGNKFREGLKPSNAFSNGHKPWNAGLKGIHLSPDSEFKPGRPSEVKVAVGTVTTRKDRNGVIRAFIKVADPNKWTMRAIKVWEDANGPVPAGMVVHHKDRNPLNDELSNLQCMTRREHRLEHDLELAIARKLRALREKPIQEVLL